MLGEVLDGRYRIVDVLGRGGIAIVYRAQQLLVHERDVAVKILTSTRASTAQRFETEARIIARLRHPNTLKLLDSGRTPDGRLYLVTECLHGTSLAQRLADGPISALATVRIMAQVAEALIEAHEEGVIHRDLKPGNIFLEQVGSQEVVKVLDFGIAKLVDANSITAPMMIFGTPGFMAPEQCLGQTVDGRTDLYALGVIGYLCLSGRLPVDGSSVEQVVALTIERDPMPLGRLPGLEDLDPLLEGLIMQLLAKDPRDRLPDAAAVADACWRIERAAGGTDPVPIPGHSVAAPSDEAPTPEAPTPEEDPGDETELAPITRPDTPADRPDPTLLLPPRSGPSPAAEVGSGPSARAAAPRPRSDSTMPPLAATEPSSQLLLQARRRRMRRQLTLAVGSAVVVGALATLLVALLMR
ncbi:MAG: protein kinase [Deltaproteobacteria bacterium]|nr:protein kinase [Deltaproteobacteria bacterium]